MRAWLSRCSRSPTPSPGSSCAHRRDPARQALHPGQATPRGERRGARCAARSRARAMNSATLIAQRAARLRRDVERTIVVTRERVRRRRRALHTRGDRGRGRRRGGARARRSRTRHRTRRGRGLRAGALHPRRLPRALDPLELQALLDAEPLRCGRCGDDRASTATARAPMGCCSRPPGRSRPASGLTAASATASSPRPPGRPAASSGSPRCCSTSTLPARISARAARATPRGSPGREARTPYRARCSAPPDAQRSAPPHRPQPGAPATGPPAGTAAAGLSFDLRFSLRRPPCSRTTRAAHRSRRRSRGRRTSRGRSRAAAARLGPRLRGTRTAAPIRR